MMKLVRSGSPWGDRAQCRELAEDEFWDRFADADVRIAAQVVTGRATTSVPHVVEDGRLMFCAAPRNGSSDFLARNLMSVQIEGYNAREAFTVAMIGYTEDIAPASEALRLDDVVSQPNPPADRCWVRFRPISIEGRIFAVDAGPKVLGVPARTALLPPTESSKHVRRHAPRMPSTWKVT